MPKSFFQPGVKVTSEFLNAIAQGFIYDGQDLDGHLDPISDGDMSSDPAHIKAQWYSFRDAFKVTPGTGLSVTVQGGSYVLPSGVNAVLNTSAIALGDNRTNFVFLNPTGVLSVGTSLPVVSLPLAKVVTVAGAISGAIEDLRPRYRIQPRPQAIKVFGGFGDEGDKVVTGNETFAKGEYYFRNLTINAGAVLTIDRVCNIRVSGDFTCNGTINVSPAVGGVNAYNQQCDPNEDIQGTTGIGPGGGGARTPGLPYSYLLSPFGSSGSSGAIKHDIALTRTRGWFCWGGLGGGAFMLDCAGTVRVNGTITANGGDGFYPTDSDVYTSNLPSGGGGGGSGGLILLQSLTSVIVAATAILSVKGGNGGPVYLDGMPGSGGGGGRVVLACPSINTTGSTINLSGGLKTPGTGIRAGGGAGGGFGGKGGSHYGAEGVDGDPGVLQLLSYTPIG